MRSVLLVPSHASHLLVCGYVVETIGGIDGAGNVRGSRYDAHLSAAVTGFQRAISLMPMHIGTWHGQGWTHILRKDLAAARVSFEKALELDRNFAESHGGLAVVLALQGEAEAAKGQLELADRLDGANLSARYAQAVLSGDAQNAEFVQRLAERLLKARVQRG